MLTPALLGGKRTAAAIARDLGVSRKNMRVVMASIGSYVVAATIGAAAVVAIMAGTGAFADGGWVRGPGGGRDDRVS